MRNATIFMTFMCLGALSVMPPQARADEWNQKTVFTFSGPVEIPGQVLQPGTYVFKLADSASDRNIVEVLTRTRITSTASSWRFRTTVRSRPISPSSPSRSGPRDLPKR